jgi:3-isopropylmalate/(R)-2-methylmalate dehydratase large subunit
VDRDAVVRPGSTIRAYADLLPASDGTAPFAIHTFNQITGGNTIFPRQIAVANDHFVFTGKQADDRQTAIGREFAKLHGIEKPYYATPGDGIFHFYFPEQGLVMPGQFIPGADSHSRAYGAYGAVGIGVGSTTLGFGWATGYVYVTVAKQRRVVFMGLVAAVGDRQGHRARAAAALGRQAVAGHVGRVHRSRQAAADCLSQHDREHDGRG